MYKQLQRLLSISLTVTMLSSVSIVPANACAAELDGAVIISGLHPDHPLKLFAAGNIGIIQPGWAKSYLCVAYRYLTKKPLTATEQQSVLNLWHERLTHDWTYWADRPDAVETYLRTRAKALGHDAKKDLETLYSSTDRFSYEKGVNKDAFVLANKTLNSLVKQFGAKTSAVKEWVKAQDTIMGIAPGTIEIPKELPKTAPMLLRQCRAYQIASGTLYKPNYKDAEPLFEAIAKDSSSPFQKISQYLVLRCKQQHLIKDSDTTKEELNETLSALRKAAGNAKSDREREDILDLLRPLSYTGRSQEAVVEDLAQSILKGSSKRFGGDVGDLTFLMDVDYLDENGARNTETTVDSESPAKEKVTSSNNDLVQWISTIQTSDEFAYAYSDEEKAKAAKHKADSIKRALELWREKKTIPWLVTAVTRVGLRSKEHQDLFDAANKVSPDSPAYLTCKFYVIDALIAQRKTNEARKILSGILASKNLPPTTFNLFTAQMASTASTSSEFLRYAVLKPSEYISTTEVVSREMFKFAKLNSFHYEAPTYHAVVADDLNRYAPLSTWVSLANNRALDQRLRAVLSRTAWLRALLLNKPQVAQQLETEVLATNPTLARPLARYRSAAPGADKDFALAKLVLRNFGMSPYIQGGAERHGLPINGFDWYQDNYWQPLAVHKQADEDDSEYATFNYSGDPDLEKKLEEYMKPGLKQRLSASEKKIADRERNTLFINHPSRFLGQAVLKWARMHPDDKEVPEMLFKVVKLPKWSGTSEQGTKYSKEAYLLLHSRYPNNSWTDKAVCYY